jgi:amidase
LLTDRLAGTFIIRGDFKADFNNYLAGRPNAPVHSLAEVIASGIIQQSDGRWYHRRKSSRGIARNIWSTSSKRNILREAVLRVMADNNLDALAYPTTRRKANLIGETQPGTNCQLASSSGLPAISVPGGFTSDGLPVGVELARACVERATTHQARFLRAGNASPTTTPSLGR